MPGYEGSAFITNAGDSFVPFLCTGASVPRAKEALTSSAGYAGEIKTPVSEIAIGTPRAYDLDTFDGSLDFDLTENFFTDIWKPWLFDRQAAKRVKLIPRGGSLQQFNNCYWSSLSISAQEASAVSGSVNFVALERNTYTAEDEYIVNKLGDIDIDELKSTGDIPALNPSSGQANPIPFWNTNLGIDGGVGEETPDVLNWTMTFNQDVVKFFACEENTTPQVPSFVAVGIMTVTLEFEMMFLNTTATLYDELDEAVIYVGSKALTLQDLELNNATDDVRDGSSTTPIGVTYEAYTLVSS